MQGTEIGHNDEIRQIAYNIWQEEGCPDGHEVQHWLKAETIWLEEHRPQSEHKESMSLKGRRSRKAYREL